MTHHVLAGSKWWGEGVILGVMVSLRDMCSLVVPDAGFSELLLFPGELDGIGQDVVDDLLMSAPRPIEFVHVQEFMTYEDDAVLVDLASEDPSVRSVSVDIVRRTREVARGLGDARVVVHPGGIRPTPSDHGPLMSNLARSLEELGPELLLLENMPWFYLYRKTERHVSNICVTIEDMAEFEDSVEGFTLDVCHGYLSRADGDQSYGQSFIERFGEKVQHIHASDAAVPDREGLQIGEGEVDFSFLGRASVPVLVEVWNGHADNGAGFRTGIERLRELSRL